MSTRIFVHSGIHRLNPEAIFAWALLARLSQEGWAWPRVEDAKPGREGRGMDARVRENRDLAERVRAFFRAPPAMQAGYGSVLAALEELLIRAQRLEARHHDGVVAERVAMAEESHQRRLLSRGKFDTTRLEAAIEAGQRAYREKGEARAELWAVAAEIRSQVRLIDGVVRYRCWGNPEGLASWERVLSGRGLFIPESGGSDVAPAA
jgi:hypothetical protein